MNSEQYHQRCQSNARTELMLVISSIVGAVGALFALVRFGFAMALGIALLSAIAFGLSNIVALLNDLFVHLVGGSGREPGRSAGGDAAKSEL